MSRCAPPEAQWAYPLDDRWPGRGSPSRVAVGSLGRCRSEAQLGLRSVPICSGASTWSITSTAAPTTAARRPTWAGTIRR
jgi:hypothetical protein